MGQRDRGDRGLPVGRPAGGEGLACTLAEGGAAGLRGFSLGRWPARASAASDHRGGGRGRARIATGPGLRAGVVASHRSSDLEPPLGPGVSAGVRKPRVQNE